MHEQSEGEGLELFKDLGAELRHLYNIDHVRHFPALNSNEKAEAAGNRVAFNIWRFQGQIHLPAAIWTCS